MVFVGGDLAGCLVMKMKSSWMGLVHYKRDSRKISSIFHCKNTEEGTGYEPGKAHAPKNVTVFAPWS